MDPFIAEIRIFPFNFAPNGWAFCDGQILPLSQNTALFSLLGTTYGGDGKSTYGLPDLRGRAPMHPGQGQGLSLRDLGETNGVESVALLESEIPAHSHTIRITNAPGQVSTASGNMLAQSQHGTIYSSSPPNVNMSAGSIAPTGGNQPHNNMMPYLTFYFCIALQGVFPPRH
ncbi:phage tail protein [Dyadobacter subterraneus]|uniref:Phage tail protein n=1 Tax=Dyadobacter subterraneus TaxID=2773304 RepID=A0ABR9WBQ9_9BACT|nr:tail fiber protein [Dyadobacter subterraneus]MBE9461796.1 phage tail protein [Dyadobacter subterraneus]